MRKLAEVENVRVKAVFNAIHRFGKDLTSKTNENLVGQQVLVTKTLTRKYALLPSKAEVVPLEM